MGPTGWFAALDDEDLTLGTCRWQPVLYLGGWGPSLDVWFETEDACVAFIRDELLPASRLLDDGA